MLPMVIGVLSPQPLHSKKLINQISISNIHLFYSGHRESVPWTVIAAYFRAKRLSLILLAIKYM